MFYGSYFILQLNVIASRNNEKKCCFHPTFLNYLPGTIFNNQAIQLPQINKFKNEKFINIKLRKCMFKIYHTFSLLLLYILNSNGQAKDGSRGCNH